MVTFRLTRCNVRPTPDRHEFGQLVVPRRRALSLAVDSQVVDLSAAQAIWLPIGQSHHVSRNESPALVIDMSPGTLIDAGLSEPGDVRTFNLMPAAADFCGYLAGLADTESAIAAPVRRRSLGLLGALIPELAMVAGDRLSAAYTRLATPWDNGPVDDIAREACLSASQFRRRCMARYGLPPRDIRRRARRDWLCRQLAETEHSVGRLAQMLECDTATLSNFFRRETGVSPSAYRARSVNPVRE